MTLGPNISKLSDVPLIIIFPAVLQFVVFCVMTPCRNVVMLLLSAWLSAYQDRTAMPLKLSSRKTSLHGVTTHNTAT